MGSPAGKRMPRPLLVLLLTTLPALASPPAPAAPVPGPPPTKGTVVFYLAFDGSRESQTALERSGALIIGSGSAGSERFACLSDSERDRVEVLLDRLRALPRYTAGRAYLVRDFHRLDLRWRGKFHRVEGGAGP